MRVLIVDDDRPAQIALAKVLTERPDVERCDLASDAVDGLEKLSKGPYDVLLLEISLPGLSGFQLLDKMRLQELAMPAVVFVTAHEEYALAAFRQHAVDYVLKPFSRERIDEALNAAFRRVAGERATRLIEGLPQLQRMFQRRSERIAIKAKGRILFIDPTHITAVCAEGNYVLLQRETDSYLVRESLSVMADRLKPYGFIRIHRSALVNSAFVEEIRALPTGEYSLYVKGGREFTVTRSYKRNVKDIAASWNGVEGLVEH